MLWIAGVGAAISMKLSSSIDDVVWLAPFLTANAGRSAKMLHAAIYIAVCLTQTVVAMGIAYSGDRVVAMITDGKEDAWSSQKILTVGAGLLLGLYSIKLFHEYLTEGGDGDENTEMSSLEADYNKVNAEDAPQEDCEALKVPLSTKNVSDLSLESTELEEESSEEHSKAEKSRAQTLFVIAFLGSVDDLTLFVPMLVGKGFDMVQLVVGGFIAASAIVFLCVFIGLCKPVADCLSSIPLAAIVVSFATMLLVKGFFFTE